MQARVVEKGLRSLSQRRRCIIILLGPLFENVVDDRPAPGRARVGVDHVERGESHDLFRVKGKRIGDQTVDLGHRNRDMALLLARQGRGARIRMGFRFRLIDRSQPGTGSRMLLEIVAAHAFQPEQKARGNRRAGIIPVGAGKNDLLRPHRSHQIVSGQTDLPFLRRQAKRLAYHRREPWVGRDCLRPAALVETATDHQLGLLQARLQ